MRLGASPGMAVLLRLRSGSETDRFLFFKPMAKGGWYFLGMVEVFNRFNDCSYQVVRVDHKYWWVITSRAGWGIGGGSYRDHWYEVGQAGIKRGLAYTAMRWDWDGWLNRELESHVFPFTGEHLVVRFTAKYQAGNFLQGKLRPLFSKSTRIFFRWDAEARIFSFDPQKTGVSQQEYESIYQMEGPFNADSFIHHFQKDFLAMRNEKSLEQRRRLRKILNALPDSPEKEKLRFHIKRKTAKK